MLERPRSRRIKGWKAQLQATKRKAAEARQAHYNQLSLHEKIRQIKGRPGNSAKELTRLSLN